MCLKSQHFQCVFGVENDHPTIGTARLFLRRGISFETELPCVQFCYLRQHIAWLLREQKRSKVASFFGNAGTGSAPGTSSWCGRAPGGELPTPHVPWALRVRTPWGLGVTTARAPPPTPPRPLPERSSRSGHRQQNSLRAEGWKMNQTQMESKIWGGNGAMLLILVPLGDVPALTYVLDGSSLPFFNLRGLGMFSRGSRLI